MSETVYVETSVVGYLTARLSNNLILMANLGITQEWWDTRREQFTLYISPPLKPLMMRFILQLLHFTELTIF